MKSLILCAFVLLLVSQAAFALKFKDCGSQSKVKEVTVSGCENVDVCPLKRGTTVHLGIKFDSSSTAHQLKAVVHGIIAGVPMPFPVPNPDACQGSGLSCPLSSGQTYQYTHDLEVKNSYPPLSVDVKWELQDENNQDVVCIRVASKVV